MTERYLEDFEAGQTFRSGRIRIDADRIKRFATEFDPQPFHLDERAASESMFGRARSNRPGRSSRRISSGSSGLRIGKPRPALNFKGR